jgi:hypothetical protein
MKFLLRQWRVKVDGEDMGMFTPEKCSEDVARAIAKATFGGFSEIEDEGTFQQFVPESEIEV